MTKRLRVAGLGLVFLLTLEACARIDDWWRWGANPLRPYSNELLRTIDEYGVHSRPGARYEKWRINNYGFRGNDIARDKRPGTRRVIALGASETFGLYESAGMEFPAQLQRLLDTASPGRYEVLNAASPGMSPPRIVHYFKTYLERFQPDIVVFYPSPVFYLAPRAPAYQAFRAADADLAPAAPFWRLPGKLRLLGRTAVPAGVQVLARRLATEWSSRMRPAGRVFTAVPPDRPLLFGRHMVDLARTVRAAGADLVVVTHAAAVTGMQDAESRDLLATWRSLYPHLTPECLLENERAINAVIRDLRRTGEAVVVDADALMSGDRRLFADHTHFNDTGARVLAAAIVPAVLDDRTARGTPAGASVGVASRKDAPPRPGRQTS